VVRGGGATRGLGLGVVDATFKSNFSIVEEEKLESVILWATPAEFGMSP